MKTGETIKHFLNEPNIVWASWAAVVIAAGTLAVIAVRNAEIDAINRALNQGNALDMQQPLAPYVTPVPTVGTPESN